VSGSRLLARWGIPVALSGAALLTLVTEASAQTAPLTAPSAGLVYAIYKVVLLMVFFVLLAIAGNWLAKDVLLIQKQVQMWYSLFLGAAGLALVVVLAIPIFIIGFILAVGLVAGPFAYYVSWRNQRVPPQTKVFTVQHLQRILKRENVGEIAADRAVHVAGAEHLSDAYNLLYMKSNDFPIRLTPANEQEQAAFTRGEGILNEALALRAEQIQLVPHGTDLLIRYRVDNAMRDGGKLERKLGEGVIAFIKQLSELDIAEHRKPQIGRFIVLLNDKASTAVVQTAGSVKGEHLVAKLYARELLQMRLADSGMRAEQVDLFRQALDHKSGGIILMSGPPHSGRTVSMYSAVRELDLFSKNVVAVESDISIEVPGVRQMQIDKEAGASLAETLQNVLRSDPDVVMVETAADAETAQMMLLGAAAGKIMIGGVQANDISEAVQKFIRLAGDAQSVAAALLGATNQRLMRSLCQACREAYRPNPEFLRKANLEASKVDLLYREPKTRPVNKKGEQMVCPLCRNEGYIGRTAMYEVIVFDDQTREMLRTGHSITEVRTELRKQGQEFLQEEGLRKVVAGVTSVSELLRVLKPTEK
jgi:type II secretory ATPase GspE/PulE/Tfp pilus assembly ATPase PilB-like protein